VMTVAPVLSQFCIMSVIGVRCRSQDGAQYQGRSTGG
jgi:hypothetical protein